MKFTSNEILKHLDQFRPCDDVNRRAIEHICQEYGFPVNFDRKDDKLPVLSFKKFEGWLFEGLFQPGDIIVINDKSNKQLTVLVKKAFPNCIVPEATLDSENNLNIEQKKIEFRGNYRHPTQSELFSFQASIHERGFCWNGKTKKLVPDKIPKENRQVRISVMGKRVGIGIFKEIDAEGNIVMYCLKMDDEKKIRYSKNEVVGNYRYYQIDSISHKERKELTEDLSSVNLAWDGHLKSFIPLHYKRLRRYYFINSFSRVIETYDEKKSSDAKRFSRLNYFQKKTFANEILNIASNLQASYKVHKAKIGETYYIINDYFYITSHTEKNSCWDNKRFVNKNYFNKPEQAKEILKKILERRKSQLLKK